MANRRSPSEKPFGERRSIGCSRQPPLGGGRLLACCPSPIDPGLTRMPLSSWSRDSMGLDSHDRKLPGARPRSGIHRRRRVCDASSQTLWEWDCDHALPPPKPSGRGIQQASLHFAPTPTGNVPPREVARRTPRVGHAPSRVPARGVRLASPDLLLLTPASRRESRITRLDAPISLGLCAAAGASPSEQCLQQGNSSAPDRRSMGGTVSIADSVRETDAVAASQGHAIESAARPTGACFAGAALSSPRSRPKEGRFRLRGGALRSEC
ncbi:hypothetical protein JHW43_007669 [Diplocarpon mali]|nr:hypothetical protein JHW43_007669 [Diplocarpon mali]